MFETFVHIWAIRGATLLEGIAAVVTVAAGIQTTVAACMAIGKPDALVRLQHVRRRFAEWLALALEVLIASDIARTAVAPTWNDLGQLGAIVVLRIVINYTLLQDVKETE